MDLVERCVQFVGQLIDTARQDPDLVIAQIRAVPAKIKVCDPVRDPADADDGPGHMARE